MYILVAPFANSFDDIWLTYFVPKDLENYIIPGIIVDIPFQNSIAFWLVIKKIDEINIDVEVDKIKSIVWIKYDIPLLFPYQIELLSWIAKYYFSNIHSCLSVFFPSNLKEKIEKMKLNLISKREFNYLFSYKKNLTWEQEKVLEEINKSDKNKILFYWITGSGKTEIYINLVKQYLDLWKQVLILVPEIILTNQILDRFQKIFWNDVIVLNSSITSATKTKNRLDIFSSKAKIIIWTRSSLFYPYKDLGLIIMDEEHDSSYKSDSSPRIDSREIVEKMSEELDIKVVFASWTPSIKTMNKALKWDYSIVNLLNEFWK